MNLEQKKETNQNLKLRPATKNDEDFVNKLTHEVMKNYVHKTWAEEIDHKKYFYVNSFKAENTSIIQLNDKDIGRVTLIKFADHLYLDNIHILPEYQSLKIGTQVIRKIIDDAKDRKIYVKLQVLRANPAKTLYDKLGFYTYDENETHFFMRTK